VFRENAAQMVGHEKKSMLDRTDDVSTAAENWLAQFESALAAPDDGLLKTLFHPESYWRDVLALSWNLQTINGADAILRELRARGGGAAPNLFRIDPDRAAPRRVSRAGTSTIEAIFKFETAQGRGSGILRLIPDASDGNKPKAWTLLTALDELKGFEEQLARRGRAARPIRAIFAGPTGSICARRRPNMPSANPPCWWSAAARPDYRSRPG
jgi:putative flavoprotein involved in K+ transport